jgi:DNA-directed RNA polymerase subunit RPC12/RpoP
MITVACSCGKTFHVKDSFAGKKAKCSCGKVLTIPDAPSEQKQSHKTISFSCDCGKSFTVSEKIKGKKVRCKSCQNILTVPSHSEQPKDTKQKTIIIDEEEEDQKENVSTETESSEIEPESSSSEKPKRLLMVCIIMILIGAIAYGAYMYFSSKCADITPETKEQITPEAIPSAEEKQSKEETIESIPQETSDSVSESLTPLETTVQKQETTKEDIKKEPEKQSEKKIEQIAPKPKELESIEKITKSVPPPPQQPETKPPKPLPVETESKKQTTTAASVDQKPEIPKEDESLLRSHPMTYTRKQVIDMIKQFNFYDSQYNPNGGFPNRFVDNRNGTITDNETKLMWQKSGSREMMAWGKTPDYIDRLNNRKYAGYSDWRLPTLEELLTLTEARHSRQGLYISSFFSQKQGIVGSSDTCTYDGKKIPWYTSFLRGISNCVSYDLIDEFHVRAVRLVKTNKLISEKR